MVWAAATRNRAKVSKPRVRTRPEWPEEAPAAVVAVVPEGAAVSERDRLATKASPAAGGLADGRGLTWGKSAEAVSPRRCTEPWASTATLMPESLSLPPT